MYKKHLQHPESENINNQLLDFEDKLDIANILMAREQAKLEVQKLGRVARCFLYV